MQNPRARCAEVISDSTQCSFFHVYHHDDTVDFLNGWIRWIEQGSGQEQSWTIQSHLVDRERSWSIESDVGQQRHILVDRERSSSEARGGVEKRSKPPSTQTCYWLESDMNFS